MPKYITAAAESLGRFPMRIITKGAAVRRLPSVERAIVRASRLEGRYVKSESKIFSHADDWITDIPFEELPAYQSRFVRWCQKHAPWLNKRNMLIAGAGGGAAAGGVAGLEAFFGTATQAISAVVSGSLSVKNIPDIIDTLVKPLIGLFNRAGVNRGSWRNSPEYYSFFGSLGSVIEDYLFCNDVSSEDVLRRLSFLGKNGAVYTAAMLRELADDLEASYGVTSSLEDLSRDASASIDVLDPSDQSESQVSKNGDSSLHDEAKVSSVPDSVARQQEELSDEDFSRAESDFNEGAAEPKGDAEARHDAPSTGYANQLPSTDLHGSDLRQLHELRHVVLILETALRAKDLSNPITFVEVINRSSDAINPRTLY